MHLAAPGRSILADLWKEEPMCTFPRGTAPLKGMVKGTAKGTARGSQGYIRNGEVLEAGRQPYRPEASCSCRRLTR